MAALDPESTVVTYWLRPSAIFSLHVESGHSRYLPLRVTRLLLRFRIQILLDADALSPMHGSLIKTGSSRCIPRFNPHLEWIQAQPCRPILALPILKAMVGPVSDLLLNRKDEWFFPRCGRRALSEANLPERHERKGSLASVGWHEFNALRAQDKLLDRAIS